MKILLFAFLLTGSFSLYAQVDWNKDYKTLCSYDAKWCGRLKNSDGTWVKPKPEIVKLMKELAPTIKEVAAKVGVSPVAIAGAIMAENSLNVSVSDKVQDLLVRMGVADKGEILGKKFTFGLGQLNFPAAREADDHMARIEGRKPLSDKDLQEALLIPSKAIYYVAGVLRKVQDDYKKNGFDISNNPEVLTTLYNLGRSEEKAVAAKKDNKTPRANYFGFFVKKYSGSLAFLNTPVPVAPVASTPSAPVPTAQKQSVVKSRAVYTAAPVIPKVLTPAFNRAVALLAAPPTCLVETGYGSTNLKAKYSSMKSYSVTGVAGKGMSFKIIAPMIDCDSNNWKLIEMSDGTTGWIKEEELEKSVVQVLLPVQNCAPSTEAIKCNESLRKKSNSSLVEDKDKGMVYLKPFTNSEKVDFGRSDWFCTEKIPEEKGAVVHGASATLKEFLKRVRDPARKGLEINKTPELEKVSNLMKQKLAKIDRFYKMPLDNVRHPYRSISLQILKEKLENCYEKQLNNISPCQLNIEAVSKIIENLPIKEKLDANDYGFINHNIRNLRYSNDFVSKDDFIKSGSSGSFVSGFDYSDQDLYEQYQLKVGEEEAWSFGDIYQTLQSCKDNLSTIRKSIASHMNIEVAVQNKMKDGLNELEEEVLDGSLKLMRAIKKQESDDEKETFIAARPHFVQLAKVCVGYSDLFGSKLEKLPPIAQDYDCTYSELEAISSAVGKILPKDLMEQLVLTPDGVDDFAKQAMAAYRTYRFEDILAYFKPIVTTSQSGEEEVMVDASYCPNKTAEMIEELIEANPCIKHVYVPDEWLVNRLNGLGSKVIKRPFEQNDRFAVDVGNLQCK